MRRKGSVSTFFVFIIALLLLAGAAFFGVSAYGNMTAAKAERLIEAEKYGEALELYKKADKFNFSDNVKIKEGLAAAHFGLKEYDSALHYYSIVVKEEPKNAKARYRLALLYIRAGEFRKAADQAQALSEMESTEARRYAGDIVERMRDGMVKGIFEDIVDKVLPNLPSIPGINDHSTRDINPIRERNRGADDRDDADDRRDDLEEEREEAGEEAREEAEEEPEDRLDEREDGRADAIEEAREKAEEEREEEHKDEREDALEEAREKAEDKLDEAAEKLEEAGEKIEEKIEDKLEEKDGDAGKTPAEL